MRIHCPPELTHIIWVARGSYFLVVAEEFIVSCEEEIIHQVVGGYRIHLKHRLYRYPIPIDSVRCPKFSAISFIKSSAILSHVQVCLEEFYCTLIRKYYSHSD